MANEFTIVAESRSDVGKGASRRLRHTGKIPGVLYGAGKDAKSITMGHDDVLHHLEQEAFYSHILSLDLDGSAEKVVLKDVQRHPSKARILHLDFLRISETAKIHMHVPLHFIGEEAAPGCKAGGKVQHLMTGVDIACLAKDLPEFLEVNLASMELGDSLHLSDIKIPTGVDIPALAQGDDHNLPIVSIHKPKKTVEVEDTPAVAAADESAEEGGGDDA